MNDALIYRNVLGCELIYETEYVMDPNFLKSQVQRV